MLNRKQNMEMKLTLIGLLVCLFLGVLVFFMLATKATLTPKIPVIVIFMAIVLIAGTFFYLNRPSEKAKRLLEELDTYSFIDTLLDDLNRDEFDYLKRMVDDAYSDDTPNDVV